MKNEFKLKQRQKCGNCRALDFRGYPRCDLRYQIEVKSLRTSLGPVYQAKPLEPCPKPLTTDNYVYCRGVLDNNIFNSYEQLLSSQKTYL